MRIGCEWFRYTSGLTIRKLGLMEACGLDLGGCFWGMWVGFGNVEYLHTCFTAEDSCECVGKGILCVEHMVCVPHIHDLGCVVRCGVEVLLLGGEV